ncbi:MAG TPA: hypothetical protein DEH78_03170 [Solibacterales bacterium]|nr:hypothetical protein [Bryobacterales bacterium]
MDRIRFDWQQRPVIRDTGIHLDELLEWIAAGKCEAEIIRDHPSLELADFEETYRYGSLWLCAEELAGRLRDCQGELKAELTDSAMEMTSEKRPKN